MWRRSKDRYIRRYMLGEDVDLNNSGIRFGKTVSDALESGESDGDGLMEALLSMMPRYKLREHTLRAFLPTPDGPVELLGTLDTFDPKTGKFREYKTGRIRWTQHKAENHFQLHHYQTIIWLLNKKFDPLTHLDWAETEETKGFVSLTGKIESFPVKIGMMKVLEYSTLAAKVAKEISDEYRAQMKKLS